SPPIFAGSRSGEQLRLDRERALQIKRAETRLAFVMAIAHGAVELSLKQQKPSVRRPVLNDLKNRYGLKTNMRV
ncbi:MAG TPA: hypothetical protein VLF62_05895, partial [Candidatus Saccharimonadales bacterium]|nr:hypothetical protein [Candidatus Saccharimonadales bacterium]